MWRPHSTSLGDVAEVWRARFPCDFYGRTSPYSKPNPAGNADHRRGGLPPRRRSIGSLFWEATAMVPSRSTWWHGISRGFIESNPALVYDIPDVRAYYQSISIFPMPLQSANSLTGS